jgi:formylglycine-generating enzyme required for sulfatase activity
MRRRELLKLACLSAILPRAWAYSVGKEETGMSNLRSEIAGGAAELKFRLDATEWHLMRIPAGRFLMGTPLDEPGRESWELDPFAVRITKPFYMAKFEATNAQYRAVMGPQPHMSPGDERLPYDQSRFRDALEYAERLSKHLGENVTLPTEAQWEYCCRAGIQRPYYSGSGEGDLESVAWFDKNSGDGPHAVGEKKPNGFGLCDMLGNVAEPCIDYILAQEQMTHEDPVGETELGYGCARGGSWMSTAGQCRAGARIRTRDNLAGLGIRIVLHP